MAPLFLRARGNHPDHKHPKGESEIGEGLIKENRPVPLRATILGIKHRHPIGIISQKGPPVGGLEVRGPYDVHHRQHHVRTGSEQEKRDPEDVKALPAILQPIKFESNVQLRNNDAENCQRVAQMEFHMLQLGELLHPGRLLPMGDLSVDVGGRHELEGRGVREKAFLKHSAVEGSHPPEVRLVPIPTLNGLRHLQPQNEPEEPPEDHSRCQVYDELPVLLFGPDRQLQPEDQSGEESRHKHDVGDGKEVEPSVPEVERSQDEVQLAVPLDQHLPPCGFELLHRALAPPAALFDVSLESPGREPDLELLVQVDRPVALLEEGVRGGGVLRDGLGLEAADGVQMLSSEEGAGAHARRAAQRVPVDEHSVVPHDAGVVQGVAHGKVVERLGDLHEGYARGVHDVGQKSAEEGAVENHVGVHHHHVLGLRVLQTVI